jgi:hypothetical protein
VKIKNVIFWDMTHEILVRTDVSEECVASIIRVKRIGKLGTMLALKLPVTANVVHSSPILLVLAMEAIRSCKTSVLLKATRRRVPGDGIPHRHLRENIKSDIFEDGKKQ